MTTIPTTGTNLWCVTSPYAESGDPTYTDAWAFDNRYVDATSVGTWSPFKGSISPAQATGANKPTFSKAYGPGNRGMATFDGVNDLMSANALTSRFGGLSGDFTLITSLQILTVAPVTNIWSFSGTSDTSNALSLQVGSEAGNPFRVAIQDNAGTLKRLFSDFSVNTNRVVVSVVFSHSNFIQPDTCVIRVNGVATTVTASGGVVGAATFSKFTIGAFIGATTSAWLNMRLRRMTFSPQLLTGNQLAVVENGMLSEV